MADPLSPVRPTRSQSRQNFLRQVASDVAQMVARLAPVTDAAGNVVIPKAELAAELAAYFQDSFSVESFMELAYRPPSVDGHRPRVSTRS